MIRSFLFTLSLLFFFSGCAPKHQEFTRFHEDGITKPTVVLLPISNRVMVNIPWDITKELTEGVRESLLKSGNLFLTETNTALFPPERNLADLEIAKRYQPNEFVVMCEILEHNREPYKRQKIRPVYPADGKIDFVITMKARIKVLDIREETPRVVLQEIIHSNHLIPTTISDIGPDERPWGSENYMFSPVGLAHTRLKRDVARRLEEYILVAKSM